MSDILRYGTFRILYQPLRSERLCDTSHRRVDNTFGINKADDHKGLLTAEKAGRWKGSERIRKQTHISNTVKHKIDIDRFYEDLIRYRYSKSIEIYSHIF